MAHFGSRVAASVKVCSDSVYWKECRSARPLSRVGCTSVEQVVGKFTLPSWSGGAAGKVDARSKERTAHNGMAALKRRISRIGASSFWVKKDSTLVRNDGGLKFWAYPPTTPGQPCKSMKIRGLRGEHPAKRQICNYERGASEVRIDSWRE